MGRWLATLMVLAGVAGCAPETPAPSMAPEPPGPGLVGWRSIGLSNAMFESAYVQERELVDHAEFARIHPHSGNRRTGTFGALHWRISLRGSSMAPAGRGVVRTAQCAAARTCGTPTAKWLPCGGAGDAGWGVLGRRLWVVRASTIGPIVTSGSADQSSPASGEED